MAPRKGSDKPYVWLVRQPHGLLPVSQFDRELVERYRVGTHLTCTIEQPADSWINGKFHALVDLVAKGIGEHPRAMKTRLIIRAGFITSVDHFDGSTGFTPVRTSELDGPEYEELYQKVEEIVLTEYLPGIEQEDLHKNIMDFIAGRRRTTGVSS